MFVQNRQTKAELIRFWCMRAAEGRQQSRAAQKVMPHAAIRAVLDLARYFLKPRRRADIIVLAHPDRGAHVLGDVPYVGRLSTLLARRHRLLFLQMGPLKRAANVAAYPWLGMRILAQLTGRLRPGLSPEDGALVRQLAADYGIAPAAVDARMRRLNFELGQWHRLLSRHRPKMVIFVDGYSANAALIWQARQMGIASMEVQHGACGPAHSGYRMIGEAKEPLAPDHFLAWNQFWRDRMANVPGYRTKLKVCAITAQSLDHQADTASSRNGVLLIHQPTLSQVLFDLLARLPDRRDPSPVTVKYHPGILPEWEARIDEICAQKGVGILRNRPIEAVIGEYGLVIGWFSTVLHQAADAGYAVRYIPQPGYETQQRPLGERGISPLPESEFLELGAP